jgi:tetratricopeptide (TPR) repeat protein
MDAPTSTDLRDGIQLYLAQDYAGAESKLSEAVKLRPDWAEGWSYLGFSQYMQQKFTEAGASLEKAVMMDLENPEARFGLGLVWAALKRVDAAIACWNECLRIKPGHVDAKRSLVGALLYRAQGYIVEKDYDHAEADMDRAIKIDRTAPEAVVALANHFIAQGMIPRAEKTVKEALGYLPNDAHVQALSIKLNVQADKNTHVVAQDVQAKQQVQKSQEIPCPNCKRPIMEWAAICPHCNMQIKAIPSLFATRNAATPAYQWQDVMYFIVVVLWTIVGAAPFLIIGLALGFGTAFSGVEAFPMTMAIATIALGVGMLFQNDFCMTFAKWLAIIDILWSILMAMPHYYGKMPIMFVIDILSIGLNGFLIYLLNYMGTD